MINEHSTFRLVVDDFSALVGVVTTEDVCEQHIMQWVATGFQRHEVLVKYLMQPRATLMTLRYKDLDGWSAGEVASALQKDGAQHCLVLNDTNTQLRGIISARELGVHVGDSKELQRASTIAGLVASLHL